MKKLLCIVSLAALSSLSLPAFSKTTNKHVMPVQSPGAASSSVTISIPKDSMSKGATAYGENPKIVKSGTQVTWTNNDTVAHTVTSDSGAFDSGFIMPGKSWSHVFSQPGKYPYYCTLHGKQAMFGTIEVQ